MPKRLTEPGERRGSLWRVAGWSLAALLLLFPLAAMQFANNVSWSMSDFLFAGALIGGVGLAFELTLRMSHNRAYRTAVGFALAATFLTIWANAAVGMIGSEDNPLNFMFFGVLVLAVLGAVLARFRPTGMARAMTAAAIVQLLASGMGLFADTRGGILSATFAVLWLLSARSFDKAGSNGA